MLSIGFSSTKQVQTAADTVMIFHHFAQIETFTTQLLSAMKTALKGMR